MQGLSSIKDDKMLLMIHTRGEKNKTKQNIETDQRKLSDENRLKRLHRKNRRKPEKELTVNIITRSWYYCFSGN